MITWLKFHWRRLYGLLRFSSTFGFFTLFKMVIVSFFKKVYPEITDVNGFPILSPGDSEGFRRILEVDLANFETKEDDIFVVAYAKSGQHWAYDFINMLIKGNLELDNKIKETTFLEIFAGLGIGFDSLNSLPSPRVLYTHFPASVLPKEVYTKKRKVIRLIRNPKDVYVSAFHHYNQMVVERGPDGRNLQWNEFIEGAMDSIEGVSNTSIKSFESQPFMGRGLDWFSYELHLEEKINNLDHTLVLYYEDLKEDMPTQLKKLAKFLGKEYNDEFYEKIAEKTNLAYVMKNKDLGMHDAFYKKGGGLYRKGVIGDWKNHFTISQNIRFNDIIEQKMKGCPLKNSIRYEAGKMK